MGSTAAFGWCSKCNVEHCLMEGNAQQYARQLMQDLEQNKRIDYLSTPENADPGFSTDYLFGNSLGQMFGVLECMDSAGTTVYLRAFSGQYNGAWFVEGWVPPLFDLEAYEKIMIPGDHKIKALGREIDALDSGDEKRLPLKRERKLLSQTIMKQLHNLYELRNFCGQNMPLAEFFKALNGIPTGAGDCCAPKLLNHAVLNNLKPISMAEFYWGKTNKSGTCNPGNFYPSCSSRCQPILGFMLCGIKP